LLLTELPTAEGLVRAICLCENRHGSLILLTISVSSSLSESKLSEAG
jgi:hypothetical protein